MHKVHNLFEEGSGKSKCAFCDKRFATDRELGRHSQARGGYPCLPSSRNPLWLVSPPKTDQERMDTWAFKKGDLKMSPHLIVLVDADGKPVTDGQELEEGQEVEAAQVSSAVEEKMEDADNQALAPTDERVDSHTTSPTKPRAKGQGASAPSVPALDIDACDVPVQSIESQDVVGDDDGWDLDVLESMTTYLTDPTSEAAASISAQTHPASDNEVDEGQNREMSIGAQIRALLGDDFGTGPVQSREREVIVLEDDDDEQAPPTGSQTRVVIELHDDDNEPNQSGSEACPIEID